MGSIRKKGMYQDNIEIEPFQKRTWAEINLNAVKHNFEIIRQQVGNDVKICCVIKANAYGHGAVQLARVYEKLGADFFAVSNIEEAMQLRHSNITLPILILGYTDPRCALLLATNDISQCVFSEEYGENLAQQAVKDGCSVKIHIKLDTGMGRIGFPCRKENQLPVRDISRVCKFQGLIPEGIFTHFASADEGNFGEDFTKQQFRCFLKTIEELSHIGVNFQIKHCANSAAIFEYPEMHLDMVRAGVVLYGLQPSSELRNRGDLKQVITLHSIITHIKSVEKEDSISYGREYIAEEPRRVATIPIGYADGLWRSNSKENFVIEIDGQFAPAIGRICMDQCMIDISNLDNVQVGSQVTVYGLTLKNSIDSIAKRNNTINYEIVCALGERVPRVYKEDKAIVAIEDRIV